MDKLIFKERTPDLPATNDKYAHVRVSPKHYNAIAVISRKCNISLREVTDELVSFALKRVDLIERPLYEMRLKDINEDEEVKPDEDQ